MTSDLVDFVRQRMQESRTSFRTLSGRVESIKRSRLHDILHPDPTKRRPMRVAEAKLVCDALGFSQWEASLGIEILQQTTTDSTEDASRLASVLTTLLLQLAPRLADTLAGIDGLDLSDVRREHGEQIQSIVLERFKNGYSDLVARKRLKPDMCE